MSGGAESTTKQLPLKGVKVVDLTRMLAGPYASMILSDLGATVIKVESPEGDIIRAQGPYLDDDELREYGGYFQSINRGKLSVCIDLRRPEGQEIFRKLVQTADILLENFRPGVMEKLGLSYESLREINPKLVYGAVRGFGDPRTSEGKLLREDWPSYDIVSQAIGGIVGITGEHADRPVKVGAGIGDIAPALFVNIGILAALNEASRTGKGAFVDVAMTDAILAVCERIIYQHSYSGVVAGPEGNGHPLLSPFGLFESSDGQVAIAAPANKHWHLLCKAIGHEELIGDSRFEDNMSRVIHREVVSDLILAWTRTRTSKEIEEALGGLVPVGIVFTSADIVADPDFRRRSMIQEVAQPGSHRKVAIVGPPIKFADIPTPMLDRSPLLGEHTREVLTSLGLDEASIEDAFGEGIVR